MVEWWWAVLAAAVSGVLGYVGHVVRARVATRDNQDTLSDARRAEVLDHMRWAMELIVSEDPANRRLGAGQLAVLADSPYLTDDDLRRIRAATTAALAPRLRPWETGPLEDPEEEAP